MQKKFVLAAAVAGVLAAPAAFAAATVYGHLDIGLQRVDPGGGYAGSDWFVNDQQGSGGSLLGFRATDDIGGGLKGLAVVEVGFFTDAGVFDNSANQFAQRQVFAGLSGGFGTLTAGRQYREVFLAGNGAAYNYTASGIGVFFLNTYTGVRQSNFIKYATPSLGGLTFVVGYSPEGGTAGATQDDGTYTEFGAKWSAGPLSLGVVLGTETGTIGASSAAPAASGVDNDLMAVGVQYAFGPTTVYGIYTTGETDDSPKTLEASSMSFGVKHTVGNGDFVLQAGQRKNDNASNADSTLIGLAYYHRLSKMTTTYVSYGTVDNDSGVYLTAPRQATALSGAAALGEDPNTLSFGVRRFF